MSGDVTEDVMLPMTARDAHLRRTALRLRKDITDNVWIEWENPHDRAIRSLASAYADHEAGDRLSDPWPARRWSETYGWWSDQFRCHGISGGPKANARIKRLLDLVIAEGGQVVHPDRAMSPALVSV